MTHIPSHLQTDEQRQAAFTAAGVQPAPITSEVLQDQPDLSTQVVTTPPPIPVETGGVPEIPTQFDIPEPIAPTEKESLTRGLISSITGGREGLVGEAEFRAEAERVEGIRGKREELERVQQQIQALETGAQQAIIGEEEALIPTFGIAGRQASIQRQTAIRRLGLNAMFQVATGNLALANQFVSDAVSVEFDPIREQINIDLQNLALIQNLPDLTASEKAQVEARNRTLQAQQIQVENDKAEREEIYSIGILARQFGATDEQVQAIFESGSREDAVLNAGTSLQDPIAKVKLRNAQIDQIIKLNTIETNAYKLNLLKEFGGLTPEEFAKKIKDQDKEDKALKDALEVTKAQGRTLNDKVTLIDAILESKALDTVVGSNIFARGVARQKGAFSSLISGIAGVVTFGGTTGIYDEFLGADDVVGLIEQLVSKEFLQSLIDVKAQGATFGALQKAEQDALTNAAVAIGNARIFSGEGENRRVIGYDMTEKRFKEEMLIVQANAELAYKRSTLNSFLPDEQAFFNDLEELENQSNFDPSS